MDPVLTRPQIYAPDTPPLSVDAQSNNLVSNIVPPPDSLPRVLDKYEIYQGSNYPIIKAGSPIAPAVKGNDVGNIPLNVKDQKDNLANNIVPPPNSLPRTLDRTEIYKNSKYPVIEAGSPISPAVKGNDAGNIPESILEQQKDVTLSNNPDFRKGIVFEEQHRNDIYKIDEKNRQILSNIGGTPDSVLTARR